jgi:hypothetical protein
MTKEEMMRAMLVSWVNRVMVDRGRTSAHFRSPPKKTGHKIKALRPVVKCH